MKRIFILLTVIIICLCVTACGNNKAQVSDGETKEVESSDAAATSVDKETETQKADVPDSETDSAEEDTETQKPDDSAQEYSLDEMDGLYKFQGRAIVNDNGLAMLSSADIVEFNANCSGRVVVKMFAVKTPSSLIDVYFTGYVDEKRCEERFHIGEKGETEFVLANNLAEGEHSFRIVRQTEWDHGDTYFAGVKLNGELSAPPENNRLLIEFIGDSLATGFGNLSDIPDSAGSWSGAPVFQDASQAYPYRVGYSLMADISVVAIQGIGCACGGQQFTMNDIYKTYPRVREKDYTFEPERQADIVVIHMLANDAGTAGSKGVTTSEIVEKAIELVTTVRGTYPDAKIIFAPTAYYDLIYKEFEKLGGEEAGYYMTSIPMDASGKGGHPSVWGHSSAMTSLMSTIASISGMYE